MLDLSLFFRALLGERDGRALAQQFQQLGLSNRPKSAHRTQKTISEIVQPLRIDGGKQEDDNG